MGYYEKFKEKFKEKSAKDAVDSVIKLIGDSSSSSIDDNEIKNTRTNIERANTEMEKIVVGNTKLLYNLNNYKTAIKLDSLISGVPDDDDSVQYKFHTAMSECILFSNLTGKNKILSIFDNKPKDEIIKIINNIFLSNPSPKLQPAPPQGPLHISIKGNKYSVIGSKNDDSHEMNYDKVTKCWKEQVSGGATKSKRGPKSRAKSRPKSRRY